MIRLAHYFNRNILVCIPSVFEDGQPRSCKLAGIEESGLWLESDELSKTLQRLGTEQPSQGVAAFFVPFSHIAYAVGEADTFAPAPQPPPTSVVQEKEPSVVHADKSHEAEHRRPAASGRGKTKSKRRTKRENP